MTLPHKRARTSLLVGGALVALAACPAPLVGDDGGGGGSTTLRVFLGALPVAAVRERRSGAVVERESRLLDVPDDVARLQVTLDARGFVERARYERRGSRGERDVTLEHRAGVTTLRTPHGAYVIARGRPVVFLETLHHVTLARPAEVTFVDVTAGEALPGRVLPDGDTVVALDEHGAALARARRSPAAERVGPGRFVERFGTPPDVDVILRPPLRALPGPNTAVRLRGLDELSPSALALDAPGQRAEGDFVVRIDPAHVDTTPPDDADRVPAPFLESDHEAVRAFAAAHARTGVASADALSLAKAIHERLDTRGGGGPPSALRTLSSGAGDCDDATALLVAALRARGYPARPVVGYRVHEGALAPHAWAEVYDGRTWLPVDALVPGLGPFRTHLRLFEGLGSSLTMGRVLGALRVELAADETREAAAR